MATREDAFLFSIIILLTRVSDYIRAAEVTNRPRGPWPVPVG